MGTNGTLQNSTLAPEKLDLQITWNKIVVGVILYLIVLLTIVGNMLVLIAVKVDKKLQTTFNYYIVNLAITDVAVAVTAMSFQATFTVLGYWPFGEIVCALWIFFDYGMTFVSVFTLILISLDRFWCVTWSVHYRLNHTKRKCIFSILAVWMFMLVLWVPPWISDRIRNSKPGECFWDPSLNKEFVFIVAILGHHGPYVVMIFCYTYVFVFMRKRVKVSDFTKQQASNMNSAVTHSTRVECEASTSQFNNDKRVNKHAGQGLSGEGSFTEHEEASSSMKVSTLNVPENNIVAPSMGAANSSRGSKERRVFVTLTYIMIGYAILWIPFHVVFDVSIADPTLVPEQVLNLAFWMAYVNSTINPLLYNFSSPEFRIAFRRLLRRCL